MKSLTSTTGKLVLALTAAMSLAVGGWAADGTAVTKVPKSVSPTATHPVSSTAHHPAAKKPVSSSTAVHSSYHKTTTPAKTTTRHGATQHAVGKPPVRGYATHTVTNAQHHAGAYTAQHRTSATPHRYARPVPVTALNGWQRLARLRLQPERVQEIQQALIREGYLQGDPSGLWDTRTHDAMLRFQTDHGFPATGLPEAKSLMKLGLGSHPLPPELDRSQAAAPATGATQGTLPVASPPVSQVTPPSS